MTIPVIPEPAVFSAVVGDDDVLMPYGVQIDIVIKLHPVARIQDVLIIRRGILFRTPADKGIPFEVRRPSFDVVVISGKGAAIVEIRVFIIVVVPSVKLTAVGMIGHVDGLYPLRHNGIASAGYKVGAVYKIELSVTAVLSDRAELPSHKFILVAVLIAIVLRLPPSGIEEPWCLIHGMNSKG